MDIVEVGVGSLAEYGDIPIAFEVRTRLRVEPVGGGLGGMLMTEVTVSPPWVKDYDAEKGSGPSSWANRWDIGNWGVLEAREENQRRGGAVVAWNTENVNMLEGRDDIAVLWDIRVHPEHRGQGVGQALFQGAADWARQRGCAQLKIETQNINVPACRFYAVQGCVLGAIDAHAYPELPDETVLLWYLTL